jgi:hypothetical protein
MGIPEPAVRRSTLIRSAAVVWAAVGIYLSVRAILWFRTSTRPVLAFAALAIVLGFIKGRLIFARLARRNIVRIDELSPHKEKICIFAFQAYASYAIIAGMMGLGIALRHSHLDRVILAVIYLAIGSALVYGSGPYWRSARG